MIPVQSEEEALADWLDEPDTSVIRALLDSDAPGSNEEAERLMRKKLHCQARRITPESFPASELPTTPGRKP
jgi:hypothetical protein